MAGRQEGRDRTVFVRGISSMVPVEDVRELVSTFGSVEDVYVRLYVCARGRVCVAVCVRVRVCPCLHVRVRAVCPCPCVCTCAPGQGFGWLDGW